MNNIYTILEVWICQRARTHTQIYVPSSKYTNAHVSVRMMISVACKQVYFAYKYIITPQDICLAV